MKEGYIDGSKHMGGIWSALSKDELPFQPKRENHQSDNTDLRSPPMFIVGEICTIMDWYRKRKRRIYQLKNGPEQPLVIFDKQMSLQRILLHYDGKKESVKGIKGFVSIFEEELKQSHITVVSPDFIPKSKIAEEASLVRLLSQKSTETSFIKFNFNEINEFWNYSLKEEYTLLVTSKKNLVKFIKLSLMLCKENTKGVKNHPSIFLV
ncbi:hypothetical protein [Echinicola rosea]|uniref:Uncharacterized protein n=1 Tax=Echinicola rosea TaxID=1807691 RepID=A0ABQ1UXZ1_9BACT|nr:hypothetical protein [Echinicola rosea]GGF29584.1 hypothetical protein GCM10011339_17230 [Echinicola rosea]